MKRHLIYVVMVMMGVLLASCGVDKDANIMEHMKDPDNEQSVNDIVSEMEEEDQAYMLYWMVAKALPRSIQSSMSGKDPAAVYDLTFQEAIDEGKEAAKVNGVTKQDILFKVAELKEQVGIIDYDDKDALLRKDVREIVEKKDKDKTLNRILDNLSEEQRLYFRYWEAEEAIKESIDLMEAGVDAFLVYELTFDRAIEKGKELAESKGDDLDKIREKYGE